MSAASTHLRLEVISGVALGETILVEDELLIGRHASEAGRLSEDEEISRRHARISREATGSYAIEDLGSSNGTFVNGLRIQTPRLLEPGDSIETGASTLVVRELVEPADPAPTTPPPPPPLELTLKVDFEAREARLALGDGGGSMRVVFKDGAWRATP